MDTRFQGRNRGLIRHRILKKYYQQFVTILSSSELVTLQSHICLIMDLYVILIFSYFYAQENDNTIIILIQGRQKNGKV